MYYLPTVGPKAHEIGLPIRLGVLGQRKKDEWVHLEFEMNTNKYTIRGGLNWGQITFGESFVAARFSDFLFSGSFLLDSST